MSDITANMPATQETSEALKPPMVELIPSLQEFTDKYVAHVESAGPDDPVALENMLWEVRPQTKPIFDSFLAAKQRGVSYVRMHMDRIAGKQIREYDETGEEVAASPIVLGRIAMGGSYKPSLKAAAKLRDETFRELDEAGITDPSHRERGHYKIMSHNHVKTGFVGDTAWLMTNNFRGLDYTLSNFALEFNDPNAVNFIKQKFYQTEVPKIDKNDSIVLEEDEQGREKTTLLFDGGERGDSFSMERALALADSLEPGDEFTFVSQWPPIGKVMGIPFFGTMDTALRQKMAAGVKGTYLVNPADKLIPSPNARANRMVKRNLEAREAEEPNLEIVHLPKGTHAKAFFIKRKNGDTEVICGTHDFAQWTVGVGTREMSLWTKDPEITSQLEKFLKDIQQT